MLASPPALLVDSSVTLLGGDRLLTIFITMIFSIIDTVLLIITMIKIVFRTQTFDGSPMLPSPTHWMDFHLRCTYTSNPHGWQVLPSLVFPYR